jgi:hypothetical protein
MSTQPAFTERMIDWVTEEMRVEPTQLSLCLDEVTLQHTVDAHTTEAKLFSALFNNEGESFLSGFPRSHD